MNDAHEFQDIIDMFVERLPSLLENIQNAFDVQDWQRLQALTHELKGVSGSLGFPSLTDVSVAIEDKLSQDLHDGIKAHITELNTLIERVLAAKAGKETHQALQIQS